MLPGVTAVFVDYYEVLEIDPGAEAAVIKAAYDGLIDVTAAIVGGDQR